MSRPIIGIATSHSVDHTQAGPLASVSVPLEYCRAVEEAGGLPVLLPTTGSADVSQLVSTLSGLLLIGGEDVDAALYGAARLPGSDQPNRARDRTEVALVREAVRTRKPVLGVCRGVQVVNVALGGSLQQRVPEDRVEHWSSFGPSHLVSLTPGSAVQSVHGAAELMVNSFHRQAVDRLAPTLCASAFAPDGVVEAVESLDRRSPVIGVQWHPEQPGEDSSLFAWLADRARPCLAPGTSRD
jgi:putative glutamine amidotransferase